MTVAALYVDPRGPYPKIPGVDCWDNRRDAKNYEGPHPIVAHPPCTHWGRLRHLAHVFCTDCDWHGPRSKLTPGSEDATDLRCPECSCADLWSDAFLAPIAVQQVRRFGGVLEHPARSQLWKCCRETHGCDRMPSPMTWLQDAWGGFSVEIDQVEWGHVARKPTWLYIVGVRRDVVKELIESPPFPGAKPTHYASGGRTKSSRKGGAVPPGVKVCSSQQRSRTPLLLARFLVELASRARAPTASASRAPPTA